MGQSPVAVVAVVVPVGAMDYQNDLAKAWGLHGGSLWEEQFLDRLEVAERCFEDCHFHSWNEPAYHHDLILPPQPSSSCCWQRWLGSVEPAW